MLYIYLLSSVDSYVQYFQRRVLQELLVGGMRGFSSHPISQPNLDFNDPKGSKTQNYGFAKKSNWANWPQGLTNGHKNNMLRMHRDWSQWKVLPRRLQIYICFYGTTISSRAIRSSVTVTSPCHSFTTNMVKISKLSYLNVQHL